MNNDNKMLLELVQQQQEIAKLLKEIGDQQKALLTIFAQAAAEDS